MITFKRFLDEDSKELTAFESRADGFGGDRAAAKVYTDVIKGWTK